MAYGRNVAAVRYVADLMSGFVYEYYMEDPQLQAGLNLQNDKVNPGE